MSVEVFKARDAASALKQVEQVLGMDAFILSIEAAGMDVMVRASGTRPEVQPNFANFDEPQEPASENADVQLPNFLDPEHPKPFEEIEPQVNRVSVKTLAFSNTIAAPKPSAPVDQPEVVLASDVRDRIARARVVVLVTLETYAFFGVTFELLQEFPNARILTQHEQSNIPWLDASELKADPEILQDTLDANFGDSGSAEPTAIIMCQATSARFDHIVQASLDQPDVAFLVVLPIDADLSPIVGLRHRMAGVIITGDPALPDAEKYERLTDAGLYPLWSHFDGALHPLFDAGSKPTLSKLRFCSRRTGSSAFAA